MVRYHGCKPGTAYAKCNGRNAGTVRLDLSALTAEANAVSRKSSGSSATLSPSNGNGKPGCLWVVWHSDSSGTFHGVGYEGATPAPCPGTAHRNEPCPKCGSTTPTGMWGQHKHPTEMRPHPTKGGKDVAIAWQAESSSGAGQCIALVLRVQPGEEVNILLSGYDGRSNYRVVTLRGDGTTTTTPLAVWRSERSEGTED